MNYDKLDPLLAAAVDKSTNDEAPLLPIYIYTAKARDESATIFLNGIGVRVYSKNQDTFTAAVSPQTVKSLSLQPWVRYIKFSLQTTLAQP